MRYHCFSCDKEADHGSELNECYELRHEVMKVLDENDNSINHKKDEPKLAEYAELVMSKTKFLTLNDTREILYYNNGVYSLGGEIIILEQCEKIIPECSKYKVNEVIGIIQRRTFVDRTNINSNFDKIVLENGILDLNSFILSEHDSNFLNTVKLPVKYDSAARCPKFIKFLQDCLNDPRGIITVIEEMSNILTANKINFEVSAMWIGDGANGKSTLLKIIRGIFGRENCSNVSIHAMQNERFAISQLNGKLANIHSDISSKELNNLGIFKQLVSADPIPVEKKNKDPFDMINFAKMFFSANEMPDIKDNSDGAFRRIIVTKWENQFVPGVNRIEDYDRIILNEEREGIFNLVLQNYKTLLKNNDFRYRQSIAKVRATIKLESDKLLEFIETSLIKEPEAFMTKNEMYHEYTKYCESKGYEKYSKSKFGANFPTYGFKEGFKKINSKSERVWFGVRFRKIHTTSVLSC